MMKDSVPLRDIVSMMRRASSNRAVSLFIEYIERKFGAEFDIDRTRLPFEDTHLAEFSDSIEQMHSHKIISALKRRYPLPDEPHLFEFQARYGDRGTDIAVGSTTDDAALALAKTLAEATERRIWLRETDHFLDPSAGTETDFLKKRALTLRRFQSSGQPVLSPASRFLWIRGTSWTAEASMWLPAQLVSRVEDLTHFGITNEPVIRERITTGLATHPQRIEALLAGALECIERDAYMIAWLNQLTLPRFDLDQISSANAKFAVLRERCERYKLRIHILKLPTDAPVQPVAAVVEDLTSNEPTFAIGTAAHRNIAGAAEKATTEALRARRGARKQLVHNIADDSHYSRLLYWASGRSEQLKFLVAGPITDLPVQQESSANACFSDIVTWARKQDYEIVSVPFTQSRANKTGWHIEMTVIPELQPLYYNEKQPSFATKRLHDVPRQLGYTPRQRPYGDHPHPFA